MHAVIFNLEAGNRANGISTRERNPVTTCINVDSLVKFS